MALIGVLLVSCLLFPRQVQAQVTPSKKEANGTDVQPGLFILIENGLLSVSIQEVPLDRVLQAVAEKAGLEVVFSHAAEEKISLEFTGIPIDQGLKRILRGRGFLLIYGEKELKAVEVYSRENLGTELNRRWQPLLPQREYAETGAEFQQLASQAPDANDSEARLEAVEDLGLEVDEQRAAEILIQVLEWEKKGEIRKEALQAIANFENEGGLPPEAMMISINDPVREIRLHAVGMLEDLEAREELEWVAQTHNDPEVRKTAADAVE